MLSPDIFKRHNAQSAALTGVKIKINSEKGKCRAGAEVAGPSATRETGVRASGRPVASFDAGRPSAPALFFF